MKRKLIILALIVIVYLGANYLGIDLSQNQSPSGHESNSISDTTNAPESGKQLSGIGTVSQILPDDNIGSRHQRFILKLPSNKTLLIAHNIDLAPRIPSLKVGDTISFYGVYEWTKKGGVVHWTHKDPSGRHEAGWLKRNGKQYH